MEDIIKKIENDVKKFIEEYGLKPNTVFLNEETFKKIMVEMYKFQTDYSLDAKPIKIFDMDIITTDKFEGVGLIYGRK